MDKIIENLLTEFVLRASERFNLSFEDALAAVCQTKVANELVKSGRPENKSDDDLYRELLHEISMGY